MQETKTEAYTKLNPEVKLPLNTLVVSLTRVTAPGVTFRLRSQEKSEVEPSIRYLSDR